MEKDRTVKVIAILALVVAVAGLSVGFAVCLVVGFAVGFVVGL